MANPKKSRTVHVEALGDELSIYDWQRLQMHSLNPTAAQVWQMCDGHTSPQEMAARLGTPQAEVVVWHSLDELTKAHLLQNEVEKPVWYQTTSRRQFIKLGAAVALPVIVSVAVPTPVMAASAPRTITRTTHVGTVVGTGGYSVFAAFVNPITDAEIAACAPTCITYTWTGGNAATLPDPAAIFLSQALGGPRADSGIGMSQPVDDSPGEHCNYPAMWTGNRPYLGLELQYTLGATWVVGDMTVTLWR